MFKVAMINDCAYVGETLLKYLPAGIEGVLVKRSRGFWSKTFGIAYRIMRIRVNVYHVHYLPFFRTALLPHTWVRDH